MSQFPLSRATAPTEASQAYRDKLPLPLPDSGSEMMGRKISGSKEQAPLRKVALLVEWGGHTTSAPSILICTQHSTSRYHVLGSEAESDGAEKRSLRSPCTLTNSQVKCSASAGAKLDPADHGTGQRGTGKGPARTNPLTGCLPPRWPCYVGKLTTPTKSCPSLCCTQLHIFHSHRRITT